MKTKLIFLLEILLISRISAQKWTTYNTTNGLIYNKVNVIAIDTQGNKWFGTDSGVSKFDGINWITYNTAVGLGNNVVHAIEIDSKGNKWFGTDKGVSKFDGTNWITYDTIFGALYRSVNSIAIDNQGNKWFSYFYGIMRFNDTIWTKYEAPHEVNAIAVDAKNNKWFAIGGGQLGGPIMRFNDTIWTKYLYETTYDIAIDSNQNKWFTTRWQCVVKFDDSTWTSYQPQSGSLVLAHIAADADGNIWTGGNGANELGVLKFDGSIWTNYNTSNSGLVNNHITAIAIDSNGNKWFGTTDGVSKFEDKVSSLIETESTIDNISLYPNPVSEKIFIKLPQSILDSYISIYSINGKKLLSSPNMNNLIDLDMSKYKKGLYLITIITKDGVVSKKILKQ